MRGCVSCCFLREEKASSRVIRQRKGLKQTHGSLSDRPWSRHELPAARFPQPLAWDLPAAWGPSSSPGFESEGPPGHVAFRLLFYKLAQGRGHGSCSWIMCLLRGLTLSPVRMEFTLRRGKGLAQGLLSLSVW